ncbi:hypothetical protein HOLleu_04249 [Holothuria leucospilota]|uniref:Death domain-containing protein n=1 Tax=Holothuria leucospilota TaxID=206669 RepID=A0A9Q1HM99_HOLLE|nr:hypothetical protein HOLleu_04249 [Holothuria leucospilota]
MLLSWKRSNGLHATKKALDEALKKIDREDLIDKIDSFNDKTFLFLLSHCKFPFCEEVEKVSVVDIDNIDKGSCISSTEFFRKSNDSIEDEFLVSVSDSSMNIKYNASGEKLSTKQTYLFIFISNAGEMVVIILL